MIIFISIATFLATLCGGLFALHLKDRRHLVLGFSAGAIIGVAFFDLMPEAITLAGGAYGAKFIPTVIAMGFVSYLILDRFILLHGHGSEEGNVHRGIFGAGSLSLHSFLDGVAVGLAFQVSSAVGAIVAVAVLAHDFSDGINTVNLILKNQGTRRDASRWLFVDALAPVIGIVATLFFTLPKETLGIFLALFAGFFLYIGASDLLPESHHAHPVWFTTAMTLFGVGVLFLVVRFASI